ncbi:MAG TPA: hypothetical protein VFM25_12545, partial [Verrucomicrobiae bacterium]|nr:hypothetical protein [Verrucomicrobiae bacterium]
PEKTEMLKDKTANFQFLKICHSAKTLKFSENSQNLCQLRLWNVVAKRGESAEARLRQLSKFFEFRSRWVVPRFRNHARVSQSLW